MTQPIGSGVQPLANTLVDKAEKNTTVATRSNVGESSGSNGSTSASAPDNASLSGVGSLLAANSASTDDVRSYKVAALRSVINNGTYSVPASVVADSLINSMLE